ncbi:MAG: hypothetical protein MZW92_43530 [Comamonadaceae bacterium]|nr:hypothetical protein [Comamonadaceae bacterium]
MLSFTRLDIPQLRPLRVGGDLSAGRRPGDGPRSPGRPSLAARPAKALFLFRLDSAVPGRYWVRSVEPWTRWPEGALGALEPKREVIQLAEGLMYRFTLPVCAGHEHIEGGEKRVVPFESPGLIHEWFKAQCGELRVEAADGRYRHRHACASPTAALTTRSCTRWSKARSK